MRQLRQERVAELRQTYAGRKRAIAGDADLDMLERLEAEKAALREMRSGIKTVYGEIQPPMTFGTWLAEREKAHEIAREIERQREAARAHGAKRDLQHVTGQQDNSIHYERKQQHETESELGHGR